MRKLILYCILVLSLSFDGTNGLDVHAAQYLISDDYVNLQSKDVPPGYVDGTLCNRECNGRNRKCFFNFELETYYTMSRACFNCPQNVSDCFRKDCIVAGGTSRSVTVVNRQMPGPSIEVCEGDKIMVLVQNKLENHESTTIHWHGLHFIRNKYMDGAPFVTQCPILKNNNFTYQFWADQVGTFWWHSHIDNQRGDGTHGAMIIRQKKSKENHADLYDYDLSSHVIQVTDWSDLPVMEGYEGFVQGNKPMVPTGLLINGLGSQSTSRNTNTPMADFVVRKGYRFRFRLISVVYLECPMEISVDNHTMKVISADSEDLEPFEVDSLMISSGERFDFIITADQPDSTYYIRLRGKAGCAATKLFTFATLTYEGAPKSDSNKVVPTYETSAPTGGVVFNHIDIIKSSNYTKIIGIHEARSLKPLQRGLNSTQVYKFYVTTSLNYVENPAYHRAPYYGFSQVDRSKWMPSPQFNHITNTFFGVPYLPGRHQINSADFCNARTANYTECGKKFCSCPHVLKVPEDAIVEFIFVDPFNSRVGHPIHLHGYSFRVLAWEEVGKNFTREEAIRMDKEGLLKRNFVNPPLKDTVTVPKGGYAIFRLKADNIGYWLMHCHVGVHATEGMDMILKVGSDWRMPDPPRNFPTCGNFRQ